MATDDTHNTTDTDTITSTNTHTNTNPKPNPSHHSPSNSQGSSTNPPLPLSPPPDYPLKQEEEATEAAPGGGEKEEEDTAMDTGVSSQVDNKPQIHDGFQDFTAEEILKYQKYEADYACRLKAKYFSHKDIYGGDIFDLTVNIDDEPIKASRWSATRSYADPKQSFADQSKISTSGAETCPSAQNGYVTPPKKSS